MPLKSSKHQARKLWLKTRHHCAWITSDDLEQEALIHIWKSGLWESTDAALLNRVAKIGALNHLRSMIPGFKRKRPIKQVTYNDQEIAGQKNPDDAYCIWIFIKTALEWVDTRQRRIVKATLCDISFKSLSPILGVTDARVGQIYKYAIHRIQNKLMEDTNYGQRI